MANDRIKFTKPPAKPKTLGPEAEKLWDEYAIGLEYPDDDPRYIEAMIALDMLVEESTPPEPDFVEPVVATRYPSGGGAPTEYDGFGNTRPAPGYDPEEAARLSAEEKRFAQDVADLKLDWTNVKRHQEVAASVPDPEVARMYRDRAAELARAAAEKREFLRNERIASYEAKGLSHSEAIDILQTDDGFGPRLGETLPSTDDAVLKAVEAVKAGSFTPDMVDALDSKQRYALMNELGRVDPKLTDALINQVEAAGGE